MNSTSNATALESREVKPDDDVIVPVIAQELEVRTRKVETGRVRITKEVHEREESVETPIVRDQVHVERVSIDRVVTEQPEMRQEGDTLIVPIVEETFVVVKRMVLKEEIRITKKRSAEPSPVQHVTLRSEEVRVECVPAGRDNGSSPG
jgi:uncharacterized protein (TIGR02271 family)